jgi:dual specificity MAP kinase phosphatase
MIRARKKILIHCTAGISRSATLTIAYIMFSKRVTLNDAYKFVKSKRKAISPNLDFMGELQQYEKTLGLNRNSVMSMDISDDAEKSAPT